MSVDCFKRTKSEFVVIDSVVKYSCQFLHAFVCTSVWLKKICDVIRELKFIIKYLTNK